MLRITIVCVLAAFCAATATAATAQTDAAPAAWVRPEAPGRMVEIAEGRRLHILCKGDAEGPAVIFEAGLSQYTALTTYGQAQDAIAPFARVCTYDRAGLGWSDPAPAEWTQEGMVQDLHALLSAEVEGPYVLAGHSMGGVIARAYVRAYPEDVAGLILIDATAGRDFTEVETSIVAQAAQLDAAIANGRPGVPVTTMPEGTPPEVTLAFTPEILRGVKTEIEALQHLPAEMKQPGSPGALGALKLIVIARGKTAEPPSESDVNHREDQMALAALSTDSLLIVAEDSGHMIPMESPQIVADSVRRMLDALRTGTPLS